MVDLAPEGCVSLRDFYERFTTWKWKGGSPFDEIDLARRIEKLPEERRALHRAGQSSVVDRCLAEATALFAGGVLRAFAELPDGAGRHYLSPRAWREAFFPERMFLADVVGEGHGSEFDAAIGRTLFVDETTAAQQFKLDTPARAQTLSSSLLRDHVIGLVMDGVMLPSEAEYFRARWGLQPLESRPPADPYDPKNTPAWTLPMAISWVVFRNYYRVREAMDDYRANWWTWVPFHRRLPLRGGAEWFEVRGAELRTLEPLTIVRLVLLEAIERDEEYGHVKVSVKEARTLFWQLLSEGVLSAIGINPDGAVVQIPAHEWPYLTIEADDALMDRLVFANGRHAQAYDKVTVRQAEVLAQWRAPPEPPEVPLMRLIANEDTWTFLEAATWVGSKGKDLPSAVIAKEDLEERGAYALFKALFPRRGLVATGINRKRLREQIPAECWEMATMDPSKFREHHYVSFIDDVLHGYGGQLTPVGDDGPRWFGIRLEREAMFDAFPEIAKGIGVRSKGLVTSVGSEGRKLTAARQAIVSLYPEGIPRGLTDKECLTAVNAWLKERGHSTISLRTLSRTK